MALFGLSGCAAEDPAKSPPSSAGSAGAAGTGGAAGSAGISGAATGGTAGGVGMLGGTPSRPVLSAEQAEAFTVQEYLARGGSVVTPTKDDWDPSTGIGDVSGFTPTYTVAASDGTHTSVQAAITEAVGAGGTERVYILVTPGTYREVVCVPSGAPPITLYGESDDASETVVVSDHLAAQPTGTPTNPCASPSATWGTSGSATFGVLGADFQAKNLTIANDGDETLNGGGQGVALLTRGDKLVFENVRLLGNQDTLLVGTPNVSLIARSYFKGCLLAGDVDFFCGRGTAVFDGGEIRLVTDRRTTGNVLAPSTDARNAYGFLVTGVTFSADAGATAGAMSLGRAWDEGQGDVTTYATNVTTGTYPNGQAVVRASTLGAHVNGPGPWVSAATTNRPYSSTGGTYPANRLYEFDDSGP